VERRRQQQQAEMFMSSFDFSGWSDRVGSGQEIVAAKWRTAWTERAPAKVNRQPCGRQIRPHLLGQHVLPRSWREAMWRRWGMGARLGIMSRWLEGFFFYRWRLSLVSLRLG
jgi:hypothetical protein